MEEKDAMKIALTEGTPSYQLTLKLLDYLPGVDSYRIVPKENRVIHVLVCLKREDRKVVEEFFETIGEGTYFIILRVDKLNLQTEEEILNLLEGK